MVRKNMEKYGKTPIVSTTSSCKYSREREYLKKKILYYIHILYYMFQLVSISKRLVSISKRYTFFPGTPRQKKIYNYI